MNYWFFFLNSNRRRDSPATAGKQTQGLAGAVSGGEVCTLALRLEPVTTRGICALTDPGPPLSHSWGTNELLVIMIFWLCCLLPSWLFCFFLMEIAHVYMYIDDADLSLHILISDGNKIWIAIDIPIHIVNSFMWEL